MTASRLLCAIVSDLEIGDFLRFSQIQRRSGLELFRDRLSVCDVDFLNAIMGNRVSLSVHDVDVHFYAVKQGIS